MSKFRLSVLGLFAAAIASPALASDFTFTIPVNFTGLPPDVATFAYGCGVFDASGTEIANGTAPVVPISGGALSGDMSIAFNASPGRDPATASYYSCMGYFIGHSARGAVPAFYFQYPTSSAFPLVPGAPFRLDTGNVPIGH